MQPVNIREIHKLQVSVSKDENSAHLGLSRRQPAQVAHVNLTALGVDHDSNAIALLTLQLPAVPDDLPVPFVRPMAHIEPGDVNPGGS